MHPGTHGLMLKLKEKSGHLNRAPLVAVTLLVVAFYIAFTLEPVKNFRPLPT